MEATKSHSLYVNTIRFI